MMINGLLHLPSPQAHFELAQSSWPFRKTLMQSEPNPPPPPPQTLSYFNEIQI